MNYLGDEQLKLMKRLMKNEAKKSELSEKELQSISFLMSNKLVYSQPTRDGENNDITDYKYFITELGIAVYNTYIRERRRWLYPLIISILSILISLVSLCRSSSPEVNVYNRVVTSQANNKTDATHNK